MTPLLRSTQISSSGMKPGEESQALINEYGQQREQPSVYRSAQIYQEFSLENFHRQQDYSVALTMDGNDGTTRSDVE